MAVAYDTLGSGEVTGSTMNLSWTHVCTGSNLLLLVFIEHQNTSASVSSVTYNGVSMTQLQRNDHTDSLYAFYLVAPATGSHTVAVTMGSATNDISGISQSYTGVSQTSPIDNSAKASSGSPSIVVAGGRSWLSAAISGISTSGNPSSSGYTLRTDLGAGGHNIGTLDSNGIVSNGTNSPVFIWDAGSVDSTVIVSIAAQTTAYPADLSVGTFALTGFNAGITHARNAVTTVGVFTVTTYNATITWVSNKWKFSAKNSTSWTNSPKT